MSAAFFFFVTGINSGAIPDFFCLDIIACTSLKCFILRCHQALKLSSFHLDGLVFGGLYLVYNSKRCVPRLIVVVFFNRKRYNINIWISLKNLRQIPVSINLTV